ncbi:hypothetical protein XAP412_460012 [Xanthomonas phaseoli pv. phaseoli]|uniref:Uncharacterized protein n=1 Tax=Xanthomonas campestris pv. phaseoli TaxID=317013 RepID=A0AB38E3A9_XANCH|nr:hypothetical protein XAP6984_510011 [Xanthomonas phaseoli pv. phaseoli]SON85942.1 hypothetical protein XAP412_460012 [Xanthomonas phaseoli pv. phaseoli]SON90442.1 hypothetical protein XAP7430_480012 [Xanthomonas phaseoli pv. phaseoli]SOO28131.1 hypothetical protein XAP6164_2180003 [Xanthomonas phaseoli pv. phaseoli]
MAGTCVDASKVGNGAGNQVGALDARLLLAEETRLRWRAATMHARRVGRGAPRAVGGDDQRRPLAASIGLVVGAGVWLAAASQERRAGAGSRPDGLDTTQ